MKIARLPPGATADNQVVVPIPVDIGTKPARDQVREHFRQEGLALEFREVILVMPVVEQGTDIPE